MEKQKAITALKGIRERVKTLEALDADHDDIVAAFEEVIPIVMPFVDAENDKN